MGRAGLSRGLKGEAIKLESRIATLVDVFDALRNERPYKPAWTLEKTLKTIADESGRHFDPKLVKLLIDNAPRFDAIQHCLSDRHALNKEN